MKEVVQKEVKETKEVSKETPKETKAPKTNLKNIDLKSLNKKVDDLSAKIEELKEVEPEKPKSDKRISTKTEDIINKFLDRETENMMMYIWCCTVCDLKDELSGRNFYMWSYDDCKWNIKKLHKYLASRNGDIKNRNINIPTLSFSDYEDKEALMKFMLTQTEKITDEYNTLAKGLIEESDMISYNEITNILYCQLGREKELKSALKELCYPEKSVTITIEKSPYSGDVKKVTVEGTNVDLKSTY
jgi:ferritin